MKVSVIIPVKNEEKHIADLLNSLSGQSRRADEIVIVDGGSTDKTVEIINTYKINGMPTKLIEVSEALPGKGRNLAIEAAKYDIVAMTDGGAILDRCWLQNLIKHFDGNTAVDVAFGVYKCHAKSLFERCFANIYFQPKLIDGHKVRFPSAVSLMLKKDIWKKAGKFREDLRATEDLLFFKSLRKMSVKTVVVSDAVAYWRVRKNIFEAIKLSFLYSLCNASEGFFYFRHVRKYLAYALGVLFLILSFKHAIWFLALIVGFILNLLLVNKKNWEEFRIIICSHPQASFIFAVITVCCDIASLIGFAVGQFKKIAGKRCILQI